MLNLSNIQKINFKKLYIKQKKRSSFKAKTSLQWDQKAKGMNERVFKSIYVDEFLQKVELKNAKTLLDVGCGPGTLGISLASKLEKVYCVDFSKAMLKLVKQNAKEKNYKNVKTIHKSFEQNWDDVPKCDILIASRCMEVENLHKTITLLNQKAKKIYITYKIGGSFIDEDILNILKRKIVPKPDYIYLVNILYSMGIYAKVDFIKSENTKYNANSKDEFIQKIKWSLGDISPKEERRLSKFYQTKYKKQPNFVRWAFISYEIN